MSGSRVVDCSGRIRRCDFVGGGVSTLGVKPMQGTVCLPAAGGWDVNSRLLFCSRVCLPAAMLPAMMVTDSHSETVSQHPMKFFLLQVALVAVCDHSGRVVTEILCSTLETELHTETFTQAHTHAVC